MNRYLPYLPVLGIVATVSYTNPLLALERSEISTRVKEITVQIEGEDTSGTGTIIERDGDSYTVLTCWHVANTELGLTIITHNGETHEVTEIKNIDDGNIDLAIVRFESNGNYELAELGNSEAIIEGENAYVVGYPDPIPGIPDRSYTFQDTNIISKQPKGEKGYQLIHNTPTTGGSSGGGVFNEDGVLIGINGSTTSDAEGRVAYGLAIPLDVFLTEEANLTTPANFTPPQDYASLGRRKLNQKDYQGAIADFSQVLATDPNNFNALVGRAEAHYKQRDFQAAIVDYDLVLQQSDNNYIHFSYRAYAYGQLGNYEKAIADYTEAIRINSEYALAYNNRGNSYKNLKEYEKAIADYTEAIRINSEYTLAYYNRGISYKNLKEYEKAIADYTEAIRLDPEYADAYNNRGNSYSDLGEYQKAIADYTEAIRLNPTFGAAYNNRGISYDDLGESEKAIADYNEAIRLDPEYADAYNNRGISYKNLKEYQKAIADYTEAIRLNPTFGAAYFNRGIVYKRLNNNIQAIRDFQQAANLHQQQGNTKWYQQAIDQIERLQ